MLRSGLFLLIFSCLAVSARAQVLVFRSGKIISGHVLLEDADTVRFQDSAGVAMTVKKSLLDLGATRLANKNMPPSQTVAKPQEKSSRPASLAEVARLNLANRKGTCRTLTNADVAYAPVSYETRGATVRDPDLSGVKESELETRLQKAEQTYGRLKEQCRSAGGSGSPVRHVATYLVGGKPVKVEGNWADPVAIGRAKQVCARAMHAQDEMAGIREELQRRHESSSSSEMPASR